MAVNSRNSTDSQKAKTSAPVRVLFVCMGNICRSPAAEAVMHKLVAQRGLQDAILIDSAGTLDYHAGENSDPRISAAGTNRGYSFTHLARQVRRADFSEFDYIVAMDQVNLRDLKAFAPKSGAKAQVSLLLDHCREAGTCEVPDPYYGGPAGFELVMDLVEEGCKALLEKIVDQHNLG